MKRNNQIIIKTPEQINGIRQASKLVAEFLDVELPNFIKQGIKTIEIDNLASKFCAQNNSRPSFKDVPDYYHSTCTAVNNEVVHAIPGEKVLQDGDIVKVDFGVTKDGYIGDATRTFMIGEVNPKVRQLVEATKTSLELACAIVKQGNRIGDIGYTIQRHVEKQGFSVVREYVGHGVGINLHEAPSIPHYGSRNTGIELKAGMIIAIEPMINMGTWRTKVLNDGWTVVTMDGKWSAQFEDTVLVTENGAEVLTKK